MHINFNAHCSKLVIVQFLYFKLCELLSNPEVMILIKLALIENLSQKANLAVGLTFIGALI